VVGRRLVCYIISMSPSTKRLLEQIESWPEEDKEELAEYAREIEARRSGVYTMSDDERAAVRRGLAQADRGEFVPDDVIAKADKRHDL
jgi:predicted transcriptional regulator